MSEEILVFKGKYVGWERGSRIIKCWSDDDCFEILLNSDEEVAYNPPIVIYPELASITYIGNELWSNGHQYIIKYNPNTQKHKTKQPNKTNQNLKNLSTYVDEAAPIRG